MAAHRRIRFALPALAALGAPILLAAAAAVPARGQAAFACPDRLTPAGPGDPRFEQVGPPPPASGAALRGARMFDGPPGEEQEASPMEVPAQRLPRGEAATGWPVALHGSGLLLVCTYAQTRTYLRAMVPRELDHCEVTTHRPGNSRAGGGVSVICR